MDELNCSVKHLVYKMKGGRRSKEVEGQDKLVDLSDRS